MSAKLNMNQIEIRDIRDGGFYWAQRYAIEFIWTKVEKQSTFGIVLSVYTWICYFANKDNQGAWPSVSTIAKLSRVTPRSVMRAVKTLEEIGLISVNREKGRPNVYTLLDVPKFYKGRFLSSVENFGGVCGKSSDSPVTSDSEVSEPVTPQSHPYKEQDLVSNIYSREELTGCGKHQPPYPVPTKDQVKRVIEISKAVNSRIGLRQFLCRHKKLNGFPPPAEVVIDLGEQLIASPQIVNAWGWMVALLKIELPKYYAQQNIKKNEELKRSGLMSDKVYRTLMREGGEDVS